MVGVFDPLLAELREINAVFPAGRVSAAGAGQVTVTGLSGNCVLGDRLCIRATPPIHGEVMRLTADMATVLLEGPAEGVPVGALALPAGAPRISPDACWIGRIIDPDGRPLDGRPLRGGAVPMALRRAPPQAALRRRLGKRLATGTAVFDTCLPLVRGQRIGLFAGSGVGKTWLLGRFAQSVDADVVVIGLVGERGRELREFTEAVLGHQGMARSVIVAATSDQPPLLRRRAAWTATAVAEYFRDSGLHVLLLIDSVTRFAEAHRELALMSGEAASMRGFPPSVSGQIMALAERAGPGAGTAGDITAVFTVLVAGSDMDEPVADILRGSLDGHVVMDRKIAERGRFPAVDLLRSVSRSLPQAASAAENALIADARRLLGVYDSAELMIQAGLYAKGSDPEIDRAIRIWPRLDAFLAEPAPMGIESSFSRLAEVLKS